MFSFSRAISAPSFTPCKSQTISLQPLTLPWLFVLCILSKHLIPLLLTQRASTGLSFENERPLIVSVAVIVTTLTTLGFDLEPAATW